MIAAGDADLVGDALNVAARLEKACRPGHVLVGDETWRITRGELAYEPLGEVTVAGRAGPVGTYEVVATGATTAEPVAPFVGRVGETARLLAAFDQARADATAVLVTVLGSPGMGKTRLSRELASALDADERANTYEIRCDRSGGATFAPFADLIGTAAGIGDETDDGADARERGRRARRRRGRPRPGRRTSSPVCSVPRRRGRWRRRSGRSGGSSSRWRRPDRWWW